MKTLTVTEAFPEHVTTIAASAASWFETWETPWLTDTVRLRFSTRLSRAVGRCYPARRIVSLADAVRGFTPRQVLDVLCHEFAHIAAYERYGRAIRPHGEEWRSLVRLAGHTPRVCFDDEAGLRLLRAAAPRRRRYLHSCPHCGARRVAARRMPRWRCGPCYEIGRSGELEVRLLIPVESGR